MNVFECSTMERLAFSRGAVPQVTSIQTGGAVLDTPGRFRAPYPAALWLLDDTPRDPLLIRAVLFSILRI